MKLTKKQFEELDLDDRAGEIEVIESGFEVNLSNGVFRKHPKGTCTLLKNGVRVKFNWYADCEDISEPVQHYDIYINELSGFEIEGFALIDGNEEITGNDLKIYLLNYLEFKPWTDDVKDAIVAARKKS